VFRAGWTINHDRFYACLASGSGRERLFSPGFRATSRRVHCDGQPGCPGVVSHQASSWRVPRHLAKKAASATQIETTASNPATVRYRMYWLVSDPRVSRALCPGGQAHRGSSSRWD
jgi:hypothetical protein